MSTFSAQQILIHLILFVAATLTLFITLRPTTPPFSNLLHNPPPNTHKCGPHLQNTTKPTRATFFCNTTTPLTESPTLLLKHPPTSSELALLKNPTIHFLSYGNDRFKNSIRRIAKEARAFGRFTTIRAYTPKDLPDKLLSAFKPVLKYKRGGGYWVWKAYLILRDLNAAKDGDFLVYVDAGSTISIEGRKRFDEYILMLHRSKSGFLSIYRNGLPEQKWCSGRILEAFNLTNANDFLGSTQYVSGFLVMRKQPSVVKLFRDVVQMMFDDIWIITDAYGNYRSKPRFKENRHDQSLLSLARKCTGSIPVPDYVTIGNKPVPFKATRIKK